ncbi:permease [Actinocatenispora thailandica]|uniref:Permease n=1 Tax=Actinocatenispora thailandica TaxID=227318 RepID=A0A7R7DRQ7_9ACTN|nr:carbohydrate ABC transporter permease [Actinocatenispora thailandica]BCJ36302.1 permease [Actinocatenispora thailandica]
MASRIVRNVLVVLVSVLWLVPTWLVVVNAFTPAEQYTGSPRWWFASGDILGNIQTAFSTAGVGRGMVNTLIYAALGAAIAVLISALAGFAVTVMPVKRPAIWFWGIYIGTVLPLQTFLSPLFTGYAKTGLYDTQYGMLLIYVAMTIPFAFFVNRNFLMTVPREIAEAAQLDGANWLRMFVRVHLPLARSALLATFVFQFTWIWNDLLFGITLSLSPNVRPVTATLADLSGSYGTAGPPVILAGALVASIPTVLLFFVFQRFFVNSLRLTS